MVAENKTTFDRRVVLSLFMTRNRGVDKEMYLGRLALDLFCDDNVAIIPEWKATILSAFCPSTRRKFKQSSFYYGNVFN
jgi:hypothetical protein